MGMILSALLPGLAVAGSFDGSRPLLCATIETVECSAGADCVLGTAESIEVPQFLRIDFSGKVITAERPDNTILNTGITGMQTLDDRLILQGTDNGMGWTISIARDSGKMAVAVSGNAIGFIVFGACTIP